MYGLAHRVLKLLLERDAQPEDDFDNRRSREAGKVLRTRKPTTWTWVMAQLLDVLRQYPGGLGEPALMTEILSRRLRNQGKLDCAAAGTWNGDPSSSSVLGEGGFLPGQVTLNSLTKAQRTTALGQASLKTSSTAVASVACVECLHPPYGSGPPYETADGLWLLHLEEGGPAAAAAAGEAARRGTGPRIAGAAVIPMYLHSGLRLLVMGRMPLLAAGRRVRMAAVPPRSNPETAKLLRLLPTRYMVPELSVSLLAPGCWPHFDALRNGGTDPMLLHRANEGALGAVLPGSRAKVGGWVLARVVSIGAAPPREPGAFDRHRKRIIYLADPADFPEAAAAASVPGAASITATLVMYGDAVALGDLMLPGEVVAIYEPTVFVHETGTAAHWGRQALSYEHSPDTLLAVIPSGKVQLPNTCPPTQSGGTAPMDLDGEVPAAVTANLRPAGAALPVSAINGPQQHSEWSSNPQSPSASQAPSHAFRGLGSFGLEIDIWRSQIIGCGAAAAAASMSSGCKAVLNAGVSCTVVVARIHAVLSYARDTGTTHGGCLRVLVSDGTGSAAVEMQLARGSKVLSHMREGHVVMLMGAVQLPADNTAQELLVASAVEALRMQKQLPSSNGGGSVAASGALDPPIRIHTLAWSEMKMGSEACSLTAMPAYVNTPQLVTYTSLAALKLAHLQVARHRLRQHHQPQQHPEQRHDCRIPQQSHWPADILRAVAAVSYQLPDPRDAWGNDVPYLQRPFCLVATGGDSGTPGLGPHRNGGGIPAYQTGGTWSGLGTSGTGAMAFTVSRSLRPKETHSLGASESAGGIDEAAREMTMAVASAGPGGSKLVACAPDAWCGALACVVEVRSAHVETHRVHRQCGRFVRRAASMFMDFDFDMDDDSGAGVVGRSEAVGGGADTSCAAPAQGPASLASHDTPSKDQSMEGLWECAFCGLDLVKDDITWQYHGSLTLDDVAPAAGAGAAGTVTQAVTLPADPEALHVLNPPLQSFMGVSAASFHPLGTAQRRQVVERCLVDRGGLLRRWVVALYPKPWRQQAQHCGPVVALSFNGTDSCGSRRPISPDGRDTCCQLFDYWAVAQLHPVD